MMRRPLSLASLAAVALLMVGACSGGSGDGAPKAQNPLGRELNEARAAKADQSQLDILSKPSVTYADYEAAMNRYFDCLRKAGYPVAEGGTTKSNGVTTLEYSVQQREGAPRASDGSDAVSAACYTKYAKFVDGYWQADSPDALAFEQRREKALGPDLRACLREHSVDVPADASFVDMIRLSTQLVESNSAADCMTAIGYASWQG